MSKTINEEELTASSYLITFYKEIGLLTHASAVYKEIITELKGTYGDKLDEIEGDHKAKLKEAVANTRYHAYKVYIQYIGITKSLDKTEEEQKTIKEQYQALTKNYIISDETLNNYVISVNNFLVTNVMRSLLESSNQLINDIYGSNT